jgi:hypothetical protein
VHVRPAAGAEQKWNRTGKPRAESRSKLLAALAPMVTWAGSEETATLNGLPARRRHSRQ